MNYPSKLIEKAVEAFASLPGVGQKTALRLVLHLIERELDEVSRFTQAIQLLREGIRHCEQCGNIADAPTCAVCADKRRDHSTICVVEGIRDVMAIEDTGQYRGLYHVLGGIISPIEGIGPADLNIERLLERAGQGDVKEIIMAISPTIEGETTIFYLSQRLQGRGLRISTIARGVAFGGELQYADELTLGRSIAARTPYARPNE